MDTPPVRCKHFDLKAAVLAYHFGEAGDIPQEMRYSVLAGQMALRSSAFRDALRFFQRALVLLPSDAGGDGDETPTMMHYGLGEAFAGLGALREAQGQFQTSLQFARAHADRKC